MCKEKYTDERKSLGFSPWHVDIWHIHGVQCILPSLPLWTHQHPGLQHLLGCLTGFYNTDRRDWIMMIMTDQETSLYIMTLSGIRFFFLTRQNKTTHTKPPALHSLQHHEVGSLHSNLWWPLNPCEGGSPRSNSALCWQQSAEQSLRLCPDRTGWHQYMSPVGGNRKMIKVVTKKTTNIQETCPVLLYWPATPPQPGGPCEQQHAGRSHHRGPSGGLRLHKVLCNLQLSFLTGQIKRSGTNEGLLVHTPATCINDRDARGCLKT